MLPHPLLHTTDSIPAHTPRPPKATTSPRGPTRPASSSSRHDRPAPAPRAATADTSKPRPSRSPRAPPPRGNVPRPRTGCASRRRTHRHAPRRRGAGGLACVCSFWPYQFVTGLLERAVERNPGVDVQTETPVLRVVEEEGGSAGAGAVVVHTERGAVRAGKVVFATNAYTAALLPEYRGIITPYKGTAAHLAVRDGRAPVYPHLSHTYGAQLGLRSRPGSRDCGLPEPEVRWRNRGRGRQMDLRGETAPVARHSRRLDALRSHYGRWLLRWVYARGTSEGGKTAVRRPR